MRNPLQGLLVFTKTPPHVAATVIGQRITDGEANYPVCPYGRQRHVAVELLRLIVRWEIELNAVRQHIREGWTE